MRRKSGVMSCPKPVKLVKEKRVVVRAAISPEADCAEVALSVALPIMKVLYGIVHIAGDLPNDMTNAHDKGWE